MKTKTAIIVLWLFLAGTYTSAQEAPWSFVPTGISHTIFLAAENVPVIEGTPIDSGDYIGVFYVDGSGRLQNAGYTQWTGANTYITAYGDDGVNPGFEEGDTLRYKIRRAGPSCDVTDLQATYLTGSIYISAGLFETNGISGLAALIGTVPDIVYPVTETCEGDIFIDPIADASTGGLVNYISSSPDLVVDTLTGRIDLSKSAPGNYTIHLVTDLCLKSYAIEFLLLSSLSVINIPKVITSCGPYTLALQEEGNTYLWSTGATSDSITIASSGDYWVEITNEAGCKMIKTFKAKISNLSVTDPPGEIAYTPCANTATVMLDLNKIAGGIPPYAFQVSNIAGSVFDQVESNTYLLPDRETYDLKITDSLGCQYTMQGAFPVYNDEECPYNIISPNHDGISEGFYLKDQGLAKIYDRSGILKRELTIPAEWDGRDLAGNILPTGVYCIIINGQKKKFVTIVR